MKVTAPVTGSMLNRFPSAPPRLYDKVVFTSGSVAVAVYTVPLAFSLKLAVAPLVTVGASLTLVTVMATSRTDD